MQVPLEVTFRDMDKSEALEGYVRRYVDRLEKFCDHIDSCRVAIERPHRHQTKGSDYRVRIDLTVPPGHELVVVRDAGEGDIHDDAYKVLHEAFKAAERRVKKLVELQRGDVKRHPSRDVSAVIEQIHDGFGFLRTIDGRQIYFHKHSVVGTSWDELRVGAGVAFSEEPGDRGPQASTVRIVDRRGHAPGANG